MSIWHTSDPQVRSDVLESIIVEVKDWLEQGGDALDALDSMVFLETLLRDNGFLED